MTKAKSVSGIHDLIYENDRHTIVIKSGARNAHREGIAMNIADLARAQRDRLMVKAIDRNGTWLAEATDLPIDPEPYKDNDWFILYPSEVGMKLVAEQPGSEKPTDRTRTNEIGVALVIVKDGLYFQGDRKGQPIWGSWTNRTFQTHYGAEQRARLYDAEVRNVTLVM